jgi:hypothetical protein
LKFSRHLKKEHSISHLYTRTVGSHFYWWKRSIHKGLGKWSVWEIWNEKWWIASTVHPDPSCTILKIIKNYNNLVGEMSICFSSKRKKAEGIAAFLRALPADVLF